MRGKADLTFAGLLLLALPSQAQQPTPHAGYVYPAGGRQGDTFEVTVGGQFLDGVHRACVSRGGIDAKVIEHTKPLTPAQLNKLRERLRELMQKRTAAFQQQTARGGQGELNAAVNVVWTAGDERVLAELREKLATFVRRPASPAIAETVRLQVTVASNAEPGERELRLATPAGLTNPLLFHVGQLPEFSRQPARVRADTPLAQAARFRVQAIRSTPETPIEITLPATVNGQITPGGVDRYLFLAVKGQRLVAGAAARALMPYISDAVPGWFQAVLALYDANGKEVAYADDYRFQPDPVLYYEVPKDGDYVLEIRDALYRGREDFVYRITAGELPFVTGMFPLGGQAGARTVIEVQGWNLPGEWIAHDSKAKGVYRISVRNAVSGSNRLPFAVDTLPEHIERESNDDFTNAQAVKLPIVMNARIDRPGDRDVYRFSGRAGEEIVAEVFARRLDSPLDSFLELSDATCRQLAANDDHEDKSTGLITHHADSRISVRLPKKGTYYLRLADIQGKGGREYSYRLRISRPEPDFQLRVVPASVSARPGATVPITVYALRKDGFTGDIALRLNDAPRGFALSGGWVPGQQEKVRLTLSVPESQSESPFRLSLEGYATIQGREVRRPAVPAEDMMQAFAYQHLVPAQEWLVQVAGPPRTRRPWKISSGHPVKLPAGGAAPVRLSLPVARFASQLRLSLSEPPEGIAIESVSRAWDGFSILLRADAAKVKPGLKGNLIVEAFVERAATGRDGSKRTAARRQPLGTLPAIPFEVVRP
ncbi:MAG: PPC domain-containing protein [Acidobacteria bacterium]|nr:PPC domain-containing protein [Acidobacteriota bacterium]